MPWELFHVLGRMNVCRFHAQELGPAIRVLLHRGVVKFEKAQARDIEYISRMGDSGEQQTGALLALLQGLFGAAAIG